MCIEHSYHFFGMHLLWWLIWPLFIFSLFGLYPSVSKKNHKENSPLDILKKRFASGQITKEEYKESKEILEKDSPSGKQN